MNKRVVLAKIRKADDLIGEIKRDIGFTRCARLKQAHEALKSAQFQLDDAMTFIELSDAKG